MKLARMLWGIAAGLGVLAVGGIAGALGRRCAFPALVVGDSLAVGLGAAMGRLRPGTTEVDAQVGEPPQTTVERMAGRLSSHPAPRTVVIWTGANRVGSLSPDQIALLVQRAAVQARDSGRSVVVVELPNVPAFEGAERAVNDAIRRRLAAATVISPSVAADHIARDGLHLTMDGYAAVARRVLRFFS